MKTNFNQQIPPKGNTMKKFLILTTTSLVLAFASPAMAGDDASCGNTSGEWMSRDAVKSVMADKGYDVRRVKREDSCYEIYAIDKTGARVEVYLNPVSGEIVRIKNKSRS